MDTMMALRAHARGGPEQLVYEPAPAPVPGPGEVLLAVHAAAITFAELTWDQTWTTRDGRDRTPVIPAHEMSGSVAGLGDGVTALASRGRGVRADRLRPGRGRGGLVSLPAAELAAKPRRLGRRTATLPLAALTAWQALVDRAALQPGERVLVLGGAGGVGVTRCSSRRSSAARSPRPAGTGRGPGPRPGRTVFLGRPG